MWLRVECILFCNLQNRAWTHTVLVIGLYELLCNPTTYKCNSLSNRALITDMIIISIIFFHWFELETVIKLIKTIYWIDSLYALKWNTPHSCFCQYTFTCTCRLALRHIGAIMAMIVWSLDLQLPMQSVSVYHHQRCEFESRSGEV